MSLSAILVGACVSVFGVALIVAGGWMIWRGAMLMQGVI